jgi:four helix bundle protein
LNAAVQWFELEVVSLEDDEILQYQKSIAIAKINLKKKKMNIKDTKFPKIFNFEDRLVRFAGECIFFSRKLEKIFEHDYYKNQLIRSSGSSSLNYGEAQGTITDKDFIFKVSLSVKELKESRNSLKILDYIKAGNEEERKK